ncbi:MAG: murein biosynthesis integral membrane protein MurJ, partial [Candidatus Omnitrophota bacterium]
MFFKVVKNTTIVGLGTFISRLLGFLRDVLIANYFGTSYLLEAFIVAFKIPNLMRSLLGEGFSDSVAVPVLSGYHRDKKELFSIANNLFLILAAVTFLISLGGMLSSRYLIVIVAPGFTRDPVQFSMAVSFLRVTFLYLFLIGLATTLKALLYALKKFFLPAFSPCFLNISLIVGVIFFRSMLGDFVLVISVLIAGGLDLFLSLLYLRRYGFGLKIDYRKAVGDSVVVKMIKLFLPRIWSVIVYQINVIIDTIFASLSWIVGQGAMAAVYYANRVIQFPFALVALSISRVAIVDFYRFHKDGNREDFKRLLVFSLRNIIFFIVPASIFLLFVHRSLLRMLFFRGEFGEYSLSLTSSALFFYSFGLIFFCGSNIFVNAFCSLQKPLFPAKAATVSLIVNTGLNALFIYPLGVGGIALSSSIASLVNFSLLYRRLEKEVGPIRWPRASGEIAKLIVIGVILGFIGRGILNWNMPALGKIFTTFFVISGLFFVLTLIFRLRQATVVTDKIRDKL